MKIIFSLIFLSVILISPCFADKYYYFEQNAFSSKKNIIYYNKKLLAVNVPNLNLWYLAYANSNKIITFNSLEKLYKINSYDLFHGNAAQSVGSSSIKEVKTTPWQFVRRFSKKSIKYIVVEKIALSPNPIKGKNNSAMYSLSVNNVKFKRLVAIVADDMKLTNAQSVIFSDIYGLSGLDYLPTEAFMVELNDHEKTFLKTIKIQQVDSAIEKLFDIKKYRKAKTVNEIYYSKSKLFDTMNDFLQVQK